jgi:hypothetical protein
MPAADYAAAVAPLMQQRLQNPDSNPALVDRVKSAHWLTPDVVALGALASTSMSIGEPGVDRLLAWVADTHGVVVAVDTFLQSKAILSSSASYPNPLGYGALGWSRPGFQPEVVDLRVRLADANAADYAAAAARLRASELSANATALAAFLAPTEDDLIARALDPAYLRVGNKDLLLPALATAAQLAAVLGSDIGAHLTGTGFYPATYATVAARLGSAADGLIIATLEQTPAVPERTELLDLLSMCPTRAAYCTLITHSEMRGAHAALRSATSRFPALAITELLGADTDFTRYEAAAFARSQPDIAGAALPDLEPGLVERLRELAAGDDGPPDADPLPVLPTAKGAPGRWLVAQMLPPLLLRDGQHCLAGLRVDEVFSALAAGADSGRHTASILHQHCDPASLAHWARAVFTQYELADCPAKDRWVMELQGWVGDDNTVAYLVPRIRAWPGEGSSARALIGLDVLGEIGTESALRELYQFSQRAIFRSLRTRADEKISLIAAHRNLSAEELADRLLPDCGFSAAATLPLNYGGRIFTVSLDDGLRPHLSSPDGHALTALPKPTLGDDLELAAAAAKQLSATRKQLRGFLASQARRLSQAMRHQRRLPAVDFVANYLGHPLMNIVARQLVWGVFGDLGQLTASFMVTRDHCFADHLGQPVHLATSDAIGLVHPAQLDKHTLAIWQAHAARRNPVFPQLTRGTDTLSDAERSDCRIDRATGWRVPAGALLGMAKTGWERTAPADAGAQSGVELRLPTGQTVTIHLTPGFFAGAVSAYPEQTITGVTITPDTFADVDPVLAVEILNDLTELSRHRS